MKPFLLCLGLLVMQPSSWLIALEVDEVAIDYSQCGYRASATPLPWVPAELFVAREEGDVTARVQAAIDEVSRWTPDGDGFRGAVLLERGDHEIAGQLQIRASGVVLRGQPGTRLRATGSDRRTVIRLGGAPDAGADEVASSQVTDPMVPVGACRLTVEAAAPFRVGDSIWVTRPSTEEWIETLGMDRFLVGWRPGSRDVRWERRITAIEGSSLTLDAPLTVALEARFGGGTVSRFSWPGRIERVGVEQIEIASVALREDPKDEDHAWVGISMENVRDAWVRQVTFRGLSGSAVMLWETASRVTVRDCLSLEPVSELGGHRRDTFFTRGEQTLFLRCWSEEGMRDFIVGHCAAGPNAFVACEAERAHGDSGPIGSWASGVLYDNVKIERASLRLDNRWVDHHGAGWVSANGMLWQCSAAEIHCYDPPTAQNQAVGVWGRYFGNGGFESVDEFAPETSLFVEQWKRRGLQGEAHLGPVGQRHFGATNPRPEQAQAFVRESNAPAMTVRDVVEALPPLSKENGDGAPLVWRDMKKRESPAMSHKDMSVRNGWLTVGETVKLGKRRVVPWWRGNTRPGEAEKMGGALTRFVPGRVGMGYTDDLAEVAKGMVKSRIAALEHHYGLWYDRRRDDHVRVRRPDGNVSAPFYEQPFARSGRGVAWDGLSRYDLERPNPWYWNRLRGFASEAVKHGVLLYHQHYFQHNLLEAGAHWSDSPWRSANNVNETGFPEPPPYISDKRIFQAHLFYDVDHPRRRELHQQYIRQCLQNFVGKSNVLHFTSGEYTGPLAFVQFWIDTVLEWKRDTGEEVWVALSAPKDVQDAILEDPVRSAAVSVIDIRYWWYTKDGELYAPEGGKHLAPRQHQRQGRPRSASSQSVTRAVREYRLRYPDKAVIASFTDDGWGALLGSASVPNVPDLPDGLLRSLPKMVPVPHGLFGENVYGIGDAEAGYLLRVGEGELEALDETFHQRWIDPGTGQPSEGESGILWLEPRGK